MTDEERSRVVSMIIDSISTPIELGINLELKTDRDYVTVTKASGSHEARVIVANEDTKVMTISVLVSCLRPSPHMLNAITEILEGIIL